MSNFLGTLSSFDVSDLSNVHDEHLIVMLVPFANNIEVHFHEVPIGQMARRIIEFVNPLNETLQVDIRQDLESNQNIVMDWSTNVIRAKSEVFLTLSWTPSSFVYGREVMQVTFGKHTKDLIVSLKSKPTEKLRSHKENLKSVKTLNESNSFLNERNIFLQDQNVRQKVSDSELLIDFDDDLHMSCDLFSCSGHQELLDDNLTILDMAIPEDSEPDSQRSDKENLYRTQSIEKKIYKKSLTNEWNKSRDASRESGDFELLIELEVKPQDSELRKRTLNLQVKPLIPKPYKAQDFQALSEEEEEPLKKVFLKQEPLQDPFLYSYIFSDPEKVQFYLKLFTNWLNAIIAKSLDSNTLNYEQIDFNEIMNHLQKRRRSIAGFPKTLDKDKCSLNFDLYREKASEFYQRAKLQTCFTKLENYLQKNTIKLRSDCKLHSNPVDQRKLLELLFRFSPVWLRLALELVLEEQIPMSNALDLNELARFIYEKMFCGSSYEKRKMKSMKQLEDQEKGVRSFILLNMLKIFLFLDQVKGAAVIDLQVSLFNKNSLYRETKELFLKFSQSFLSFKGDILRELKRFDFVLTYKQTSIEDFDFRVKNIAIDLRDGVRLAKVMDILLLKTSDQEICQQLRLPIVRLEDKVHNMACSLQALKALPFDLDGEIRPIDIVEGHREKTLSLLWQLMFRFYSPLHVKNLRIIQKWWHLQWVKVQTKRLQAKENQRIQYQACVVIQSFVRQTLAKRFVNWFKDNINLLASIIQQHVRGFLSKRIYKKQKQSVRVIQNACRTWKKSRQQRCVYLQSKAKILDLQQFLKPWLLQAVVQKFRNSFKILKISAELCQLNIKSALQAQTNFLIYKKQQKAARVLQRFLINRKFMLKERSKYQWFRCQVKSLQIIVRASLRGENQRFCFLYLKKVTLKFQLYQKMKRKRLAYQKLRVNAIRVQQIHRAVVGKDEHVVKFKSELFYIIYMQKKIKALKAALELKGNYILLLNNSKSMQLSIKAWQKGLVQRRLFQTRRETAVQCQQQAKAWLQMLKNQKNYLDKVKYTIFIQNWSKALTQSALQKQKYQNLKLLSQKVQNLARARSARRASLILWHSVVVLQKYFHLFLKMKRQRFHYQQMKIMTIFLQQQYKAYIIMLPAKEDFQLKIQMIKNLQKMQKALQTKEKQKQKYLNIKNIIKTFQIKVVAQILSTEKMHEFAARKSQIQDLQQICKAEFAMQQAKQMFQSKRQASFLIKKLFTLRKKSKICRLKYVENLELIKLVQRSSKSFDVAQLEQQRLRQSLKELRTFQELCKALVKMQALHLSFQKVRSSTSLLQLKIPLILIMRKERRTFQASKAATIELQQQVKAFGLMIQKRTQFALDLKKVKYSQELSLSKLQMLQHSLVFRKFQVSLVQLQAHGRGLLARTRFKLKQTPEMRTLHFQSRAAVVIQSHLRTFQVKQTWNSPPFQLIRKKLKISSQIPARDKYTVSKQIRDNVKVLKGRCTTAETFQVLKSLDHLSLLVPYTLTEDFDFIATFCYKKMAQAIRSENDRHLIEWCCRIILNLARFDSKAPNIFQDQGLVTIAQMLLRWSDKDSDIFKTLCTLLFVFSQCPFKKRIIRKHLTSTESIYMLRETRKLIKRKEKMNQNLRKNNLLPKESKKKAPAVDALPKLRCDFGVCRTEAYVFQSNDVAFETILRTFEIKNL